MNISQEKKDNLNAVITINISAEDYQPRVDKAIKDNAKKAKLPGFRPGMVPAGHIKKVYGKSILVDEVNNLLSDTLNNYITENNIEILGQPLPDADDDKAYNWDFADNFEFKYDIGLAPEFTIDLSSADQLTQYDIKADGETLSARIKNLRRSYGKMTNPDVSADDDVLYAELTQLSPDGAVFEGGITNTTSIRLDQIKDEAVKAQLIGLKKQDELVFDIQQAYSNDAARVAAILKIDEAAAADLKSNFKLHVKNINRLEESDLDQAFFDKIFGEGVVTTEEEFRSRIKDELEGMMAQDSERRLQNDIYNLALQKINFPLPDEFLRRWLKATNPKLSDEELTAGYDDFAKNLKWTLIANKVVQDNNIEIKYEDVFQLAKLRLDQQFRMYSQQPMTEEQLGQYTVQFMQNQENANRIFEEVKAQKVFEYLKGTLTLNKQEISHADFGKLGE